jgi:hypothetical protein
MTVDVTQPASPAEFVAAGASPAEAAILAEQHEAIVGRRGPEARAAILIGSRDLPPPPAPPPPVSTVTQTQATEALAAHTEAQMSAQLDQTFAPPATPAEYKFPYTRDPSDEQFAADNALKAAMHAERMPKFVVDSIAQNLAETSRALANETPAQAQTRIEANKTRLTALWKNDGGFDANIAKIDSMLGWMSARSPALKAFIDANAHALTPLDLDLLLQVANHRAARR